MSKKKEQLAQAEKYLAGLQAAAEVGQTIVDKLRQLLDEPAEPEAVKEWPQKGNIYCFATSGGFWDSAEWDSDTRDFERFAIGNVFRTKELVMRRVEALRVAAELRRMPGRCAAPIVEENDRWGITKYSDQQFTVCLWTNQAAALAGVWFESREAAQHALDTIGQDRLGVWLADFLDEPMGDE